MKIETFKAKDFLGLKHIDIALGSVTLISGENWSGKSSLQNAIRYCVLGELTRVNLKNQAGQLVREGAKGASLKANIVGIDNLGAESSVGVTLTLKGKAERFEAGPLVDEIVALPYLLNPGLFLLVSDNDRFDLLFRLSRGWDREKIAAMMIKRDANERFVNDRVLPILRSDVGSAHAEARKMAAEARSRWRDITGEPYGETKAQSWTPTLEDKRLSAAEKAKRKESLAIAERELGEFAPKFHRCQIFASGGEMTCPDCGSIFNLHETADGIDARMQVEKFANAHAMLERMVENRRGLVHAAALLDEDYDRQKSNQEKFSVNAAAEHALVSSWVEIEKMLAPDGIPLTLAREVIYALNADMQLTAAATGWGQVSLRPDGGITYDGRIIDLCSEAQRWLASAMIADAIGRHAGHPILMLDRMDVLMVKERGAFMRWCLSRGGDAQTIVFATLKAAPLIDGVTSFWIDDGEINLGAS